MQSAQFNDFYIGTSVLCVFPHFFSFSFHWSRLFLCIGSSLSAFNVYSAHLHVFWNIFLCIRSIYAPVPRVSRLCNCSIYVFSGWKCFSHCFTCFHTFTPFCALLHIFGVVIIFLHWFCQLHWNIIFSDLGLFCALAHYSAFAHLLHVFSGHAYYVFPTVPLHIFYALFHINFITAIERQCFMQPRKVSRHPSSMVFHQHCISQVAMYHDLHSVFLSWVQDVEDAITDIELRCLGQHFLGSRGSTPSRR